MRRAIEIRIIAFLAALAAVLGVVPASQAACTAGGSQVFSRWGDLNYYSLLPNGGFESGKNQWTLAGTASVASGNESFELAGDGSWSLSLPAGSSALSPSFCIESATPLVRWVQRLASGTTGTLAVDALVNGTAYRLATVTGTSTVWAPSPQVGIWLSSFSALTGTGSLTAQLRIAAASGSWRVDDVYLDPLKRR